MPLPMSPILLDPIAPPKTPSPIPSPHTATRAVWEVGLILILAFQIWFFSRAIGRPWTDDADFNGAVWSQAAHNFLKAGIVSTAGVPAPFHFGPMPIPKHLYYGHHPSLLALTVTAVFRIFGEHEWAARMVPITCSVASTVLLWFLVRSCAGPGTATFAAVFFATLPMELRWGQMVNFEPGALMWMLVGFLGLRYWNLTGKKRWKAVMLLGLVASMLTAWLGYMLVLLLSIHFWLFDRERRGRLALLLVGISIFCGGLFLCQISWVQPHAIPDLATAFSLRLSQTADSRNFTFLDWLLRMQNSWNRHFPPPFLGFALLGAAHLFKNRNESKNLRWLGWVCGALFVMNAFYVLVFQNASYIHDYASFYFISPVSILAVLGAQRVGHWAEKQVGRIGPIVSLGLVIVVGGIGCIQVQSLNSRPHILDSNQSEPKNLIPELGKLIRAEFPADAEVLCNIDPYFTPQLWYYSNRKLVTGFTKPAYWLSYFSSSSQLRGGIVWLGAPDSEAILALLDVKSRRTVWVQGIPFCIWKPGKE